LVFAEGEKIATTLSEAVAGTAESCFKNGNTEHMKYSPRQYAEVLLSALEGKLEKERKEILKRFVSVLAKNRDLSRLGAILCELEREFFKKSGMKKIWVESVSPLSVGLRKEIEAAVGGKTYLHEKINPSLLAGIRILINDELLIDASARRQIEKLFKVGLRTVHELDL